ncbi:MAG: hypothetical protein AB1631_16720 [Acidobacteriota bacterium]
MQLKKILCVLTLSLAAFGIHSSAQTKEQLSVDEIIRRFAAAESENKLARSNYLFTQDVDVMTLGEAGSITGRFKRVSDITLDNQGNRFEKITFFPPSSLVGVSMSPEDLNDLGGIQPFALTAEDLPKYIIEYRGKEKIDELDAYVFDVRPKMIKRGERYLEGRIWVDDEDLQIVKVAGKGVPEDSQNKYPHFESFRENIDGRYWFPTYVYADDVLEFKSHSVRLKMIVRYINYKKFSTSIRVLDEGDIATEEDLKNAEKDKADKSKAEKDKPAEAKKGEAKPKEKKPPER